MTAVRDDSALRLMLISDVAGRDPADVAARIDLICKRAQPGSVIVQLRDKELSARARIEFGKALAQAAHGAGQWFIVNERVDIAVLLAADGVHLPEESISPREVHSLFATSAKRIPWISTAWHDIERKPPSDANAYVVSPIVQERKGRPALGLSALKQARAQLEPTQRLFALGGIDAHTAGACLEHGADAVAVIGAAFDADPIPLLRALGIERSP
ncbi:MAG TPA: thiamine phosphate synthase [Polyangiaceae bacterium]|nr:thiamine phosphate synthase [Polyangiaceae bacterium]